MVGMPKPLPRPCPKCGQNTGGVRFIRFNNKWVTFCQIEHSTPNGRKRCGFITDQRIPELELWFTRNHTQRTSSLWCKTCDDWKLPSCFKDGHRIIWRRTCKSESLTAREHELERIKMFGWHVA